MFGFGKSKTNKVKKGFQHSQYWLPKESFDYDLADDENRKNSTANAIKLASIKRSIANFVRITTNKAIPVVFSSGKQSYTTGEAVVISASTKEKKFDAVVGLALHEGTHCILTDFDFLKALVKYYDEMLPDHLVKMAEKIGMDAKKRQQFVKDLWNIIEDRRIDNYMYKKARGYRPYYDAMYDNYFNNRQIDVALGLRLWTKPTVINYVNTIINIVNPYFDTSLLPDLDLIVGILDLPNINRLDDDKAGHTYAKSIANKIQYAADVAVFEYDKMPKIWHMICKIAEVILRNSTEYGAVEQTGQPGNEGEEDDSKGPNMDCGGLPGDSEGEESDESDGDDSGESTLDGSEKRQQVKGQDPNKKMKKSDLDKLKKALQDQKKFLDGDVKKKKASKKLEDAIKAIEDSDATMKDVQYQNRARTYGGSGTTTTQVLVLKNLTRSIMESGAYPFCQKGYGNDSLYRNGEMEQAVEEGFRKGAILARKLMIRNQSQTTKFNRRNSGKIDKRRLAQLGTQNEDVFYRLREVEYKPVHLHLSVDNSGSMSGDKFRRAMTVGIALAVAADKIENLDVELSIRAAPDRHATISIIYDSKKDKPIKIRQLFPYLRCNGVTPEGLCFAAILDTLTKRNADEQYFINLSDGEPYFQDYGGDWAWRHTRSQVNEMRRAGVKILAYYIEDGYGRNYYYGGRRSADGRHEGFDTMYGKDAEYIDVEQITGLIRTLNKLFLVQ